jgi:N-hydroxyarylamine O-acetyltransferase
MNVSAYLERINYVGSREPTLETLRALHRQHLFSIPYENLDIHLGRRLELDEEHIFKKIVLEKRGGWCYEMNGLFAWVLHELGFDVQYLSGTVGRERKGSEAEGNHLVLLVKLEQPHIADVGFGDLPEPLLLQEGEYKQDFLTVSLSKDGERWVVHNHEYGGAKGFDFTLTPHQLSDFAKQCHTLQTSPDSGFVQKTVCQIFLPDGFATLRGAVLKTVRESGVEKRVLNSETKYTNVLRNVFRLELPEASDLYAKVWQRHLAWLESGGVVQ